MKGLELAKEYYRAYGEEMLRAFEKSDRVTVGLIGEGSECLGFDDEISVDHDFEPGFCMWLDRADEREFGFKLERAYAKLPKEFMGYKRLPISPAGGSRHGVIVTEDFFTKYLGSPSAPEEYTDWLKIPQSYLALLAAGEIFKSGEGKFAGVREAILKGYPEDVRRKKLAANLAFMGQSGQYNYMRSVQRGESGAAQLAVYEFVQNAVKAIYLLNKKYCPYYKWEFHGMRDLKLLSDLEDPLVYLLETGNDASVAAYKRDIIEDSVRMILGEARAQGLSGATCNNCDTHAFSVTDGIKDPVLRNMHILFGE